MFHKIIIILRAEPLYLLMKVQRIFKKRYWSAKQKIKSIDLIF